MKKSKKPLHKLPQLTKLKHAVYDFLNKPGFRPILGILASIMASIRVKKLCRFSYNGEWIQKFPTGTLVEPRLSLWTAPEIEAHTRDIFLYKYAPKKGDTVIDVGAGTGWETLYYSKSVGASGRVISIEAHPTTFRCLSKLCEINGLKNVTPMQVAVGSEEGEIRFSDSEDHEGNRVDSSESGIRVRAVTLDNMTRSLGIKTVDLIKMNIEGAERPALSGMRELVHNTKHVCISCHDFLAGNSPSDEYRTKADVIKFLKENGFSVFVRESDVRSNVRDFVYGINDRLVKNPSELKS